MSKEINNLLIPNVSKLPDQKKVNGNLNQKAPGEQSEFSKLLDSKLAYIPENHGVKLSNHALKRISERQLNIDSKEYLKLREGIDKLKEKGGRDSLIVTNDAAYIVDVGNDTVVTAIDKSKMAENVFTKIDSTVFIN